MGKPTSVPATGVRLGKGHGSLWCQLSVRVQWSQHQLAIGPVCVSGIGASYQSQVGSLTPSHRVRQCALPNQLSGGTSVSEASEGALHRQLEQGNRLHTAGGGRRTLFTKNFHPHAVWKEFIVQTLSYCQQSSFQNSNRLQRKVGKSMKYT